MDKRLFAAMAVALAALAMTGCEIFWRLGFGTPKLALIRVGDETQVFSGGTYDAGTFDRGDTPGPMDFRIINAGDGMWKTASGENGVVTLQGDGTNWKGDLYGASDNSTEVDTLFPGQVPDASPGRVIDLRLGWDVYAPDAPDIVPPGQHAFDIVLEGDQEYFRATITYTVREKATGYLGMSVETTPELEGLSMDAMVYSTWAEGYFPQDMSLDSTWPAAQIFLSTIYDPAELPNGDYTVVLWVDMDDNEMREASELSYTTGVTIAGGDAWIGVSAADLVPSVAQAVTVTGGPADGTLVCLWLVPGGDLSAPAGFTDAKLLSTPIGSVVAVGLGTVSGGVGTTDMADALIPPGTYDLYCFIDEASDFSLVTFAPLAATDEYAARVNAVVVTGAGTTVSAGDFVVVP